MPIRYPGVIVVSAAMALHAAAVGRYLESVFFIIAFCWAWVAVTAYRDKLQSAQSMVLTMLVLLVLVVLPITLLRLDEGSLMAHLCLAIVPGIISWACMFIYIRHIRRQGEYDHEADFVTDLDWANEMALILGDIVPDRSPLKASSERYSAIISAPPANTNARTRRQRPDQAETEPSAALSTDGVAKIIASLRPRRRSSEAA